MVEPKGSYVYERVGHWVKLLLWWNSHQLTTDNSEIAWLSPFPALEHKKRTGDMAILLHTSCSGPQDELSVCIRRTVIKSNALVTAATVYTIHCSIPERTGARIAYYSPSLPPPFHIFHWSTLFLLFCLL